MLKALLAQALAAVVTAHPAPAITGLNTVAAGEVRVTSVLDSDTVVVNGMQQRVRLANIDAPEMSHGYGKPGQPFSVQARDWLARALENRPGVTMKCADEDRYGRAVCDFYSDEAHVNKELVRAGLAWANTANKRYLRDRSVFDAQVEAQAARKGLWSAPKTTAPWDWRHGCWERRQAC